MSNKKDITTITIGITDIKNLETWVDEIQATWEQLRHLFQNPPKITIEATPIKEISRV